MKAIGMLSLCLATTAFSAADQAAAPAPKNPSFERLKSLAGTWTGRAVHDEGGQQGGGEMTVVYKLTGAASVVEETMFPGAPEEMVTMYHMDGDQLMLTHYCAGGNQPRMKLEAPTKDPNLLAFRCAGGTNMKESDSHMHAAKITFVDADHITGVWDSAKDGKATGQARFDLTRKK